MADRPVFVCGAPRSGTTLLMRILACTRNLGFPKYETWYFSNIHNRMKLIYDLDREEQLSALLDSFSRIAHGFYRQFVDDEAVLRHLRESDQRPETIFDILQTEVVARQGKSRWGEKSPGNEFYADEILSAFPSARLIYIFRDFRDVATSRKFKPNIQGKKMHLGDSLRGAMMWKKSVQQHLYNLNILPHDQYYAVKYEQMLKQPVETLERLGEFIEEPVTDCLQFVDGEYSFVPLKDYDAALGPPSTSNSSYREQGRANRLSTSSVGRHREKLSPFELVLIERLCHYEARLTGYCDDRRSLKGSDTWLKLITGKSKHWEGQLGKRLEKPSLPLP